MKNLICVFGIIILLCGSQIIRAQEILTDRPDQTETAASVSKGQFQIESGYSLNKVLEESSLTLFSNLYRYGIGSGFELRLAHEINFSNILSKPDAGKDISFSDIELGGKYGLAAPGLDIAILSHLVIPSRSENDDAKFGIINKLALAGDISESLGIGCNIGYDYFGEGKGNITFSTALGFSLTESIGFYTEIYGDFLDCSKADVNYDNGFTYLIKDNFQLDFSFGTGLTERSNFVSLGLSWCTM
jgi:hypothetical protein